MEKPRTVVWFSCGVASAVAGYLTLKDTPDAVLVYCDTGSEHMDSVRFRLDCEKWLDTPILMIRSRRYRDTWQVFEERRYLSGPRGALCTTELKKIPRREFQLPNDIQVFGYTFGEAARATRFSEANPEVDLRTPLIEFGLTKADCHALIHEVGIGTPAMYGLGYKNNNCIGCVKGGAGYWNKIRRDFPEVFDRMAGIERVLGASIIRRNGQRVFLDELSPDMGRYESEPEITCGLLCEAALRGEEE